MVNEFTYYIDGKPYLVTVKYKRMKNTYIRFDGSSFKITCPYHTSLKWLKSGLDKRAKRILERSVKANAIGDDYIFLLDEKIPLSYPGEILFTDNSKMTFKDEKELYKKLKKWFLDILTYRTDFYAKQMHAPSYFVKLRQMKSRYGSNNRRTQTITYSLTLIHYSLEIIDSVIIHELTHCFVYDHSDNFYRLLYKYCPNYDTLRKKLIHAEFK